MSLNLGSFLHEGIFTANEDVIRLLADKTGYFKVRCPFCKTMHEFFRDEYGKRECKTCKSVFHINGI